MSKSPGTPERLEEWLRRLGSVSARRSKRTERVLGVLAFLLFAGATVAAYLHLPPMPEGVRFEFFLFVGLVGAPGIVMVNAAEFRVSGRIYGVRVPMQECVRVSLLGTAANLLPLPGAVLVRTRALKQHGLPYRRGGMAAAVVGIGWLGTTGVMAGPLLTSAPRTTRLGLGLLSAGFILLALARFAVGRIAPTGTAARLWMQLIVVEAGAVVVATFNYYFVLRGLQVDATVSQAVAFSVAVALASASGIFPGGMGIRELLAGVVGGVVGLSVALGVFTAAVNRVIELGVLTPIALIMTVRGGGSARTADDGEKLTHDGTDGMES